jgi:hypothetical protein
MVFHCVPVHRTGEALRRRSISIVRSNVRESPGTKEFVGIELGPLNKGSESWLVMMGTETTDGAADP